METTPTDEQAATAPDPDTEEAPPIAPVASPREMVQILLKVPVEVKDKFEKQASIAYQYEWIDSPTLTKLFNWMVMKFLDTYIKATIAKRQQMLQQQPDDTSREGG